MAELSQVGRPITASDIETWLDILRNGEAADYYTENGKVNPALFDEDNRIRYPVYESVALRILDILRPA
ncbi:hypothetical protein CQZ93_19540 [Ochrobactrum vermis]|nr:hypothetical protein CQZ93_19540 [Ochrobactrum vermis]